MSFISQEDTSSSISYLTSFFCHVIVAECKVGQFFKYHWIDKMSKLGQSHSKLPFAKQLLPSGKLVNSFTIIDLTRRQKLVNLIGNIIFCNTQCQIGQFHYVIEFARRQKFVNLKSNIDFCHVIVAECKVGQFFNIIELTRCQNLVNLILNFLFASQLLPSP